MEPPVPIEMPLQLFAYHVQAAPLPKLPPSTDSEVELPWQINVWVAEIPVGAVDLTLTLKYAPFVVLFPQAFSIEQE
jgi:hypothetical protein